jgi:hypothetical protein
MICPVELADEMSALMAHGEIGDGLWNMKQHARPASVSTDQASLF